MCLCGFCCLIVVRHTYIRIELFILWNYYLERLCLNTKYLLEKGSDLAMKSRIEKLQKDIPDKNKDIGLYAKHVINSLEEFEDYHRRLVAAQAIAGIKPVGDQEVMFYETVRSMKEQIISTLEKTIDDLKHKGDKYHEKHFQDGVE